MAGAVGGAGELEAWGGPFIDVMGHKNPRSWAPL